MKYANVIFYNTILEQKKELRIPVEISADTLVRTFNNVFALGIDEDSDSERYFISENPIAFIKGGTELCDFGIRNGSIIIYSR